jgi:dipeptidyl-peptidase-4
MRNLLTLALTCVVSAPAVAAEPPIDTSFLKQYAETRGFMLGRPSKPKVTPDGKTVLFLRSEATKAKNKLFEFDVKSRETNELLSPETLLKGAEENLSPEEKARRERQRVSVGGFADYHLDSEGKRVLLMLSGKPYVFDRSTGKARGLAVGKGTIVDAKWSPDGKFVSYVRDYDVYVYDLAADKEFAVTTGGTEEKTNGLAEFVAQEEMDRHTGYWWSPDSKSIAFAEADHAGVEVWYLADPLKPDAAPQKQYYPRPGKKNVSVRLGIRKLSGGDTVWMAWPKNDGGAKFEYLARVVWQKYGPLTVVLQDCKQQEADAFSLEPTDGSTKRLFSMRTWKKHDWIDLAQAEIRWTKTREVLLAAADFALRNEQVKVIVAANPELPVFAIQSFDPDTRFVAFATRMDQAEAEVYCGVLPLETPYKTKDFKNYFWGWNAHGFASFAGSNKLAVITSTGLDQMPVSEAGRGGELPSVALEPTFKPNVKITTADDFSTALVRPREFDPKKKYPVIVDVYGGPHHIHVQRAMRNWLVPQWLADQGFIVVAIDNRGTPGRGREWERAIYQNFGTVPIEDQAKALAALGKKFPELDLDRVGIVGWSFGGYNAANAVLRRPDVFKAAVAGAPVTDWTDYDTHYTERYLGLLPESKPAYDDASLIPLAKNLSRPLLLVHGTADDNVYYRHTLKLSDALFRAGKEFESLPLPGVTHMYSADPVVMEKLWLRNVTFFRKHLGAPK